MHMNLHLYVRSIYFIAIKFSVDGILNCCCMLRLTQTRRKQSVQRESMLLFLRAAHDKTSYFPLYFFVYVCA